MISSKMLRSALESEEVKEEVITSVEKPTEEVVEEVTEQQTTPVETDPVATDPAQTDKKLDREKELVFYAKIVNFDELKKCTDITHQEQFEVKIPKTDKNAIGGRIRVRKSVKAGQEPTYENTTKTKLPDGSEYEHDCDSTERNFIQFKYMAENGMIKDRYVFPVDGQPDLKWEVDVFTGTNGLLQEWCKIDLELKENLPNLPAFPIELSDIIFNQNGQRTPEEEAIVRTLYDTVFRIPNPVISEAKEVV